MHKRAFCAFWMALFALAAAYPLWWAQQEGLSFVGMASPLLAGAIVGGLLQPLAIGRQSTAVAAALLGVVSAILAMPLVLLAILLMQDPSIAFSFTETGKAIGFSLFFSLFGFFIVGWPPVVFGALGGFTLQLAWTRWESWREAAAKPAADRPDVI